VQLVGHLYIHTFARKNENKEYVVKTAGLLRFKIYLLTGKQDETKRARIATPRVPFYLRLHSLCSDLTHLSSCPAHTHLLLTELDR